jgi:hypothetical protein
MMLADDPSVLADHNAVGVWHVAVTDVGSDVMKSIAAPIVGA